jgi:hypothetical protein
VRLLERGLAQHPFECGAANDEHGEVFVTGTGLAEIGGERKGGAADGLERVEHIGEALAHQDGDTREEAVGLVGLRRATPLGREGLLGAGGGGQGIALEDGDRVAVAAEGQGGRQPTNPAPDDDDVLHEAEL